MMAFYELTGVNPMYPIMIGALWLFIFWIIDTGQYGHSRGMSFKERCVAATVLIGVGAMMMCMFGAFMWLFTMQFSIEGCTRAVC